MKSFLFLLYAFTFVALAHCDDETDETKGTPEHVETIFEQCQSNPTTHLDENDEKKLFRGEDVATIGAHVFCMTTKMGLQKPNGDIDVDTLKEKLKEIIKDDAKVEENLKICSTKEATPEGTAIKLFKCFRTAMASVNPQPTSK